jgi:hypothetical protein
VLSLVLSEVVSMMPMTLEGWHKVAGRRLGRRLMLSVVLFLVLNDIAGYY